MKKTLGVFAIVILCGLLVVGGLQFFGFQASNITQANTLQTVLSENSFDSTSFEQHSGGPVETYLGVLPGDALFTMPSRNGIYIQRPPQADIDELEKRNAGSFFYGDVHVDTNTFDNDYFVFTAARFVGNRRNPGMRYLGDGWEETNWFSVGRIGQSNSAEFTIRKILPAGTYGIHMQPFNNAFVFDPELGEMMRTHVPAMSWNEYYGTYEPVSQVFPVLYADELRYFSVTDDDGNNMIRARAYWGQWLALGVMSNEGAMNLGYMAPEIRTSSNFLIGNINSVNQLIGNNFQIAVDRNGVRISDWEMDSFIFHSRGGANALDVFVPSWLSNSVYTLRVWNESNPTAVGTFILDNTVTLVYNRSDLSALSTTLLVLGTLAAIAAVIIFVLPKYLYWRQEKQYRTVENKRYMTKGDGAKTDKHFKAQSARDSYRHSKNLTGEELKRTAKTSGFFDAMRASKERREAAREAGLSMEEFRELEAQGKKLEEAKVTSLQKFRQSMETKPEPETIVEEPVEKIKARKLEQSGGIEFDMLDSYKGTDVEVVKNQAMRGDIREAFVVDEEPRSRFEDLSTSSYDAERIEVKHQESESGKVESARPGSLLSKLRNLTD
ncbi:MAG: hypothetical protein FWE01_02100 [Firmicutes bacterium]|nr:hypothetical protein [Bacillota bacterium]